jgi:NAD(P)-dependent dehydrogenase (short-subunit alcohol dehydrogenase family)
MFFSKSVAFNPKTDIPSLTGKVILVTGGNTGLGRQSVLDLARQNPAQIWLASRNIAKADKAIEEIRAEVPNAPITALKLDLASFESIRNAAETFRKGSDRLDILMLNAGIMATDPGLTKEGYEIQFGTNHMGHALLTKLLLPTLLKTADMPNVEKPRIVVLSSMANGAAPPEGIRYDSLKQEAPFSTTWTRYGQSKFANILYARALAKHYGDKLLAVSVHPGVVDTDLALPMQANSLFFKIVWPVARYFNTPVQDGVKNQLWASVAKDVKNGEYYIPVGQLATNDQMRNEELIDKFWTWTKDELKGIDA